MPQRSSLASNFLVLSNELTADPYDHSATQKVIELFKWLASATATIEHLSEPCQDDYQDTVVHLTDQSSFTIMAAYPEDRIDIVPGNSPKNFDDPARVTIQPEGPAAETFFKSTMALQRNREHTTPRNPIQ